MRNTEKVAEENPALMLMEAMMVGDNHILQMEQLGQKHVLESELLPVETVRDFDNSYREKCESALKAWGFELGPVREGDEIWREVKLPKGWTRRASGHALWSFIDDANGRERVQIFYKAAFYDRRCYYRLNCALRVDTGYPPEDTPPGEQTFTIRSSWNRVLHTVGTWDSRVKGLESSELYCQLLDDADAWLDEHYPGWKNDPTLYWDVWDLDTIKKEG